VEHAVWLGFGLGLRVRQYIFTCPVFVHTYCIHIPHLLFVDARSSLADLLRGSRVSLLASMLIEALLTVRMTDPRKKVYLRKRSRDLAQRSSVSPS
jgi:hypothetical protein